MISETTAIVRSVKSLDELFASVSDEARSAVEEQPSLEFSKIKLSYRVQAKFVLE